MRGPSESKPSGVSYEESGEPAARTHAPRVWPSLNLTLPMARIFDHVDLRVKDMARAAPFYRRLLPLLGFSVRVDIPDWLQFEAPGREATEFFGLTGDPSHVPNRTRIAFWASSRQRVDEFARLVGEFGAVNVEGPSLEGPVHYAVFFEDPSGNALEICHRSQSFQSLDEPT